MTNVQAVAARSRKLAWGCLWRSTLSAVVIIALAIALADTCSVQKTDRISFYSPAKSPVELRFVLADPKSRDGRKGFKAYLVDAKERPILIGEGAGDLYRYTYWVDVDQVNVCSLAGRIKGEAAFKLLGDDGVDREILVTTRCALREIGARSAAK